MQTLIAIEIQANKLYNQLEIGFIFNQYHDMMLDMINQCNYLEIDCEIDYKNAIEILEKCKAIIEVQNILIKQELN